MHRSPGVFFESTSARDYFLGKIIPYRGSWVEFEYETAKNILYVRIDRKRKFLASIFLRTLGLKNDEEIIRNFYTIDTIKISKEKLLWNFSPTIRGMRMSKEIRNPKTKELLAGAGRKITPSVLANMKQAKLKNLKLLPKTLKEGSRLGTLSIPTRVR